MDDHGDETPRLSDEEVLYTLRREKSAYQVDPTFR
jgi:hypothetical protein